MARLSIRLDIGSGHRLGPGKVALLEAIEAHGSISAAGRALGMSYRRAWQLVAATNAAFHAPLVTAQMGGRQGGGAVLTPLGREVVSHYRAIEREAARAAAGHISAIAAALTGSTAPPAEETGS